MGVSLQPDDWWLSVVENCTVVSSLIMIFSGVPMCVKAYLRKDVTNYPFAFFLIQAVLGVNGFIYGVLHSNTAILIMCFASIAASFFYIGIYLLMTRCNMFATVLMLLVSLTYSAILFAGFKMLTELSAISDFVGLIGCCGSFTLNTLPLLEVFRCFKIGNSSAIVMPLLVAGSINMVSWICYSLMLNDIYMLAPNIPASIVNFLRFVVLFRFPAKAVDDKKTD